MATLSVAENVCNGDRKAEARAMFTFTKKADYALLALSHMAMEGKDRLVGPREIAARYDIPAELLAKVMQTLARHHLVASVPGPTGGYKLARDAAQISVGDVVEAVDGPLAIAQCWDTSGPSGCAQSARCHLRGPLARIQEEMSGLLRAITVADVCVPTAPLFVHSTPQTRYNLKVLDREETRPL